MDSSMIILLDVSTETFDKYVSKVEEFPFSKDMSVIAFDSVEYSKREDNLVSPVLDFISGFRIYNYDIMLIRFTGEDEVVSSVGDIYTGMVIALSENKNSRYYIEGLDSEICDLIELLHN